MNQKIFLSAPAAVILVCFLSACGPQTRIAAPEIAAPEIEPPSDLIPGYVPHGFTLVAGFQLAGHPVAESGDEFPPLRRLIFNLKSPAGNEILGLYYQNPEQTILITKSAFPGGTLAAWRTAYEDSLPGHCDCECLPPRANTDLISGRFATIREEREVGGTPVAVLDSHGGWITAFVRGGDLLTVESGTPLESGGIPLEENLKIVASLLEKET
jgi:hypothetical protein